MAVTRMEIVEAIKADLLRDQEEIQEIEQRLISLQERIRANRAWLKAYGYDKKEAISAEPPPFVAEPMPILTIEEDDQLEMPAMPEMAELPEANPPEAVLEADAAMVGAVGAGQFDA